MKGALIALACLVLAGCAAATGPAEPLPTLSPAQAYYAADRTYESVLLAAVEYHDTCISTPDPLKGNCTAVVEVMRSVNRDAQEMRQLAEMAIVDGNDDLLVEATDALEDLRDRLRQEVLEQMAQDGVAVPAQE